MTKIDASQVASTCKPRRSMARTATMAAGLLVATQVVSGCAAPTDGTADAEQTEAEAVEQRAVDSVQQVAPEGAESAGMMLDASGVGVELIPKGATALKYRHSNRLLAPNWFGASVARFGGPCSAGASRNYVSWQPLWGNVWCSDIAWATADPTDCSVVAVVKASGAWERNDGECELLIYEH